MVAPITPTNVQSDGLAPNTYYTYHIVFVPDMTQKYGLRIKGGAGELRAAMNLVNGWQFTGLGPYYMKDSSTAQNLLAAGAFANLTGRGVGDVVRNVADLAGQLQEGQRLLDADDTRVTQISQSIDSLGLSCQPMTIPDYAEIHVYEPSVTCDGQMVWNEIVNLNFNRDYLGQMKQEACIGVQPGAAPVGETQSGERRNGPVLSTRPTVNEKLARQAVGAIFGVPANSLPSGLGETQSGERTAGGGSSSNVSVNKEFSLFPH